LYAAADRRHCPHQPRKGDSIHLKITPTCYFLTPCLSLSFDFLRICSVCR
jgi:hypothetical protein